MPTVDLTPCLVRDAKPGPKDNFLFDKTLPGFGLRIHPSGRTVWIVRARIEGRSHRLRIAATARCSLPRRAAAPATCSLASARAGFPPRTSASRSTYHLTILVNSAF